MAAKIEKAVSGDVMSDSSVDKYQRFGRNCYFYLQDRSAVPNTMHYTCILHLGPRKEFHTHRKQLTYRFVDIFQYFMYSYKRRKETDRGNSI